MAHIDLPPGVPGIAGLLAAYPETGAHLRGLANALLRGTSPLTPGERELIAAVVSSGNGCAFCTRSHAAAARALLGEERALVDAALVDPACAALSPRLRTLVAIALKVRADGRSVTDDDIAAAREAGADDRMIHDTVLIAAAFSLYNRYVDGLGTWTPDDGPGYAQMGERLAEHGYG